MMVVGYLYGITSERRLCREVQLNLAYRWFCGLTLEDKVPDHSTFSKNRYGRFSESGLFRGLFQAVVKQAQQHGLVKGQHLSKADCKGCARKSLCTRAPCRVVHRHLDKDFLDYAAALRGTDDYRISQRCRKKVEMLFGEAKEFMGLRYARRRGYQNLMEQCLITATVQNIKRIIRVFEERTPAITRNCIQWAADSLAPMVATVRRTMQNGNFIGNPSPC